MSRVSYTACVFVLTGLVGAASLTSVRMIDTESTAHARKPVSTQPVNAIVGDAGYSAFFGVPPDESTAETLRIVTHLAYVERLLRSRPTDHLTFDQARRRAAGLDLLRSYRMNGEFPRNTTHPGRRTPVFIDRDGRICAVGYLIRQTAGRDVAEAINDRFQFARISQIDVPVLPAWAARNGFTLRELAMIQPEYCWRSPTPAFCIVEDEKTDQKMEIAAIGLNVSSALVNGWMAARSDRNPWIAGGGLLVGGAGVAVGLADDVDFRTATLAAAGASVLVSGWNLLRRRQALGEAHPEQVTAIPDVSPTWMATGRGSYKAGIRMAWSF